MITYIQPILIALAVLLIPASARLAAKAITKKLDEGRVIAEANRVELKTTTAEEAHALSALLETHRQEVLGQLTEIKTQTTATNGKVAELDRDMTAVKAKQELLTEIYLAKQAP